MLQAALQHLPHGPEFRFIDHLIELDPGQSGAAEYRVRGDEPFLKGHFPGDPLFPGVLLVEAAAQLAGVVAQSDPALLPLRALKLTALRTIKILGSARPEETIRLRARITGRLNGLVQAEASAEVNGHQILQGQITLAGES